MAKSNGLRFYVMVLAMFVLAAFACGPGQTATAALPTVTIISPLPGSTVPVNEPVTVQASASDPDGPGVTRIDLLVDRVTVDSFTAGGPQSTVAANLTFTPETEGAIAVSVVAFRADGTSSKPATLALSVVGMTAEAPGEEETEPPGTEEGKQPSGTEEATQEATEEVPVVQGRAKLLTNIREAPGPGCPIIGHVPKDEVINLLQVTDDPDEYWYQTDYLGEDLLGWVYHDPFILLSDDSILPRVKQVGCLYCGDGVCSPEIDEACNTCEPDCGPCCGNGTCEPQFGEACNTCEVDCGPCCGNGACEAGFGENCATCEVDCGPCCGNGICEAGYGEDCATCPTDCGNCCGNGVCEAGYGENCATCEPDCGPCCGNGVCQAGRGENCATCPADCGPCCGNGICDPGENCYNCTIDCGPC
jgi:hypothetical protein